MSLIAENGFDISSLNLRIFFGSHSAPIMYGTNSVLQVGVTYGKAIVSLAYSNLETRVSHMLDYNL